MTVYNEVVTADASLEEASLSTISKDVIKYAPSKILGMLANLFLVPIYTNLLLPQEYGLYNVAITVLSFFCIIFSDWVGISGLRFFKEHDKTDNIKPYFSTLLFLLISNLILFYIVAFLMFKPICSFFKVPSNLFYLVLLLIIPVGLRALLFSILRAQIKPLTYTISVIVNQFSTIVIAIYFIKFWHLGAVSIILGMAFSIVFIDFVMLFLSKMINSLSIEKIQFDILTGFYKYGIPIAAANLGMWIISQSNKFVLLYYKGPIYNGLYGVGASLTYAIIMPLLATITLAAIPRIYNKYEEGKDVNNIITKLTGYYFIIFAPIIFILCLFAKDIVILFSNKNYADAYILIPFLALSIFVFGLAEYTTIQYHLAKKTYIITLIRIIPGILGIFISALLIPKFGILGVGIATLISHSLYLIASLIIKIKNLNWIPPYSAISKTFLALIAAAICTTILDNFVFHFTGHLGFIWQSTILLLLYYVCLKLQSVSFKELV